MATFPEYGLRPFLVRSESTGFIFNRIWAAIKREALDVVAGGVGLNAAGRRRDVEAHVRHGDRPFSSHGLRRSRPGGAAGAGAGQHAGRHTVGGRGSRSPAAPGSATTRRIGRWTFCQIFQNHVATRGVDLSEAIGHSRGTVNLRSCGRSANHISLIRHTRPGESRRRTGENRPRTAQVDSARTLPVINAFCARLGLAALLESYRRGKTPGCGSRPRPRSGRWWATW